MHGTSAGGQITDGTCSQLREHLSNKTCSLWSQTTNQSTTTTSQSDTMPNYLTKTTSMHVETRMLSAKPDLEPTKHMWESEQVKKDAHRVPHSTTLNREVRNQLISVFTQA